MGAEERERKKNGWEEEGGGRREEDREDWLGGVRGMGARGLEGEMNSKCGGKCSEGAGIQQKDGVQGQLQPNEMIRGQTAVLGPTSPSAAEVTFLNPLCIQIKI